MNPKYLNKVQELLLFGVPKNKRDHTRSFKKSQYIDPAHIMFVAFADVSEDELPSELVSYSGDETGTSRRPPYLRTVARPSCCRPIICAACSTI